MAVSTGAALLGGALLGSAVIGGVGSYLGGEAQADAAQNAANTQAASADRAAALQYKMWQEQQELQKPWLKAGEQALNKLIPLTDYQKFGMAQFQEDPGYAFRLTEGQRALDRSAAARGGLISGNALKAAQRYGQEMGSQEYMNAFNRYQTERAAQLQPLQSLAGIGQQTAQQLGQAGQQYGQTTGNIITTSGANQANALLAQGQARASAYGGIGQAVGQGVGTYMNYAQNQALINALGRG